MNETTALALIVQILAGISLAACCGLRAFLPPFIVGLAVRVGAVDLVFGQPVQLNPAFDWLSSTPALVIFGAAVIAEMLADKIPVVDHILDLVETVIRPLAGVLVVAATLKGLDPLPAAVLGLILGGSAAGGVHLAKSKIRILSTLGTGGLGSPVLSVIEDLAAFAGSLLAVFASVVAALLILVGVIFTFRLVRRFRRRAGRIKKDLHTF